VSDWREGYIICEHVAADKSALSKHRSGRACCGACCEAEDADGLPRFLFDEDLDVEQEGGFAIGRVTQ